MNDIINFFKYSEIHVQIVETAEAEKAYKKFYKVIKGKEIRWNSFHHATMRVRMLYPALISFIDKIVDNKKKYKAKDWKETQKLNKIMKSFDFCYLMHFLSDFLAPISLLIFQLQGKDYDIVLVQEQLSNAINTLEIQNSAYFNEERNKMFNPSWTFNKKTEFALEFGGTFLVEFLENCIFGSDQDVEFIIGNTKIKDSLLNFLANTSSTTFGQWYRQEMLKKGKLYIAYKNSIFRKLSK